MTDDNDTNDHNDESYVADSPAKDEGLPGEDISVWTNYRKCKVGLRLPGIGDVLVTPTRARQMADEMEEHFDIEKAVQMGYPTDELIEHIRRAADQAEGAEELTEQTATFLDAVKKLEEQSKEDDGDE